MTTTPRPVSGDDTDTRIEAIEQRARAIAADILEQAADGYAGSRETWPIADDLRSRAAALRVVTEPADGGAK